MDWISESFFGIIWNLSHSDSHPFDTLRGTGVLILHFVKIVFYDILSRHLFVKYMARLCIKKRCLFLGLRKKNLMNVYNNHTCFIWGSLDPEMLKTLSACRISLKPIRDLKRFNLFWATQLGAAKVVFHCVFCIRAPMNAIFRPIEEPKFNAPFILLPESLCFWSRMVKTFSNWAGQKYYNSLLIN